MTKPSGMELGELLGTGRTARVFAATHPTYGACAAKILHPYLAMDSVQVARFRDEARVAARVSHCNVVRVHGDGTTPGRLPFILMQQARGIPLAMLVRGSLELELPHIRQIASQLLHGLAAIHRAGLVHGDVRPDNVIVDCDAPDDHVTIIDFGCARSPDTPGPAQAGDYAAPELAGGACVTPAADLYSAGVVIYEMLTRTTPGPGHIIAPSLRAGCDIPAAFESALMRAFAPDPAQRHHDADMFATAIERSLTNGLDDRALLQGAESQRKSTRQLRTSVLDSDAIKARRLAVRDAILGDSADALVTAYLELARALATEHRGDDAVYELEAATQWLDRAGLVAASRWRLDLLLAKLYVELDRQACAQRIAHSALVRARQSGSRRGEERAGAMLRQIEAARVDTSGSGIGQPSRRVTMLRGSPLA